MTPASAISFLPRLDALLAVGSVQDVLNKRDEFVLGPDQILPHEAVVLSLIFHDVINVEGLGVPVVDPAQGDPHQADGFRDVFRVRRLLPGVVLQHIRRKRRFRKPISCISWIRTARLSRA